MSIGYQNPEGQNVSLECNAIRPGRNVPKFGRNLLYPVSVYKHSVLPTKINDITNQNAVVFTFLVTRIPNLLSDKFHLT